MEIRSVEIWSATKVLGTLYALIAVVVGILSTIAAVITNQDVGLIAGLGGGLIGTVLLLIVWAIGGAIAGFITAVGYNIVASMVGGIRIRTR